MMILYQEDDGLQQLVANWAWPKSKAKDRSSVQIEAREGRLVKQLSTVLVLPAQLLAEFDQIK